MKKIALAVIAVVLIVWAVWIAFPVSAMQSMIDGILHNRDLSIRIDGLKKGFFYRLHADRITLANTGGALLLLDSVDARINPLSFIVLRIDLSAQGRIGEGSFHADASFSRKVRAVNVDFGQARLKDIQFLTIGGIQGNGIVSGNISLSGQRWHISFSVSDAEIEPVMHGDVMVPLNFFHTVKGAMNGAGNTIDITSVSLEGRNIFARLKGLIRGNLMDLRMEVMPEKALLENPLFLAHIERYQVSPGYYVIPVKGPIVL